MPRKLKDITGELAVIQGEDWNLTKFYAIIFPGGDWSDWTPFGQLRTDLQENDGALLATFDWGEPLWDSETDYTYFYPMLSSEVTAELNPTKYQGNTTLSHKTAYLFDATISKDGQTQSASYGFVQVIGRVSHAG